MMRLRVWLLVGGLLILGVGCTSSYDSSVYPMRLTPIEQTKVFRPVDLDGDGRDELVRRAKLKDRSGQSVLLQSLSGRATAQVQFTGRLLGLNFVDLNRDGRLEIVAPVVQDDSLFYNVVSSSGEKRLRFFVVSGESRREPGGTIAWDLRNAEVRFVDVTGDGSRELVSTFTTGFAGQPRGVWIHAYPEGTLLARQRIGALVRDDYFGDMDDDSAPEWLFGSIATKNGADAGGMSDDKAYLGRIDVGIPPEVSWTQTMGGTFSEVVLRDGDLDGDEQPEFIALRKPREGRQTKSPLYKVDPTTGDPLQRFVPDAILRSVHVGRLGENGRERIVVHNARNRIRILDEQLNVVQRRDLEATIQSVQLLSPVLGDEQGEIVVQTERGTLWLAPDLSTRAATQRRGNWKIVQTGLGRPPRVTVASKTGPMIHFRIDDNAWWWVYRYGPIVGLFFGVAVVVGGGFLGVRHYRHFRLRKAVHEQVAAHSEREWLLVHPVQGLHRASAEAPRLLGFEDADELRRHPLREQVPDLADWLEALARDPAHQQGERLVVEGQTISVNGTPLEVTRRGRPYWLVWLEPASTGAETYRAQGLMAQRVAHDLKNPLTSILLTLQRMQMAYREEDGLADTLDDYTERIEERIASLRRMTTNVLKFVGKESPRRTPTDLSAFLEDLSQILAQDLPPDIEMRRDFDEDLPAVAVDQDQFRSVIENLVTNAVEAMPEGGVLTLSTRLARDLYLNEMTAHDYVVIEVRDTGVGMTTAQRARLFEPGFSTREDTGLGTAIVRKIVDDHSGHIQVESEPDVGTSMTLYLPVQSEAV